MTTAEHLWNDIAHISQMATLCQAHYMELWDRWHKGEIDTKRLDELLPSATHQMNMFLGRLSELTVVRKLDN